MPAIYHEGSWLGNATDPEVLVKDTVGWTGKNLLNITTVNGSSNGVTWVVNSDKSISVYGTATGRVDIPLLTLSRIKSDFLPLVGETLIVNGCPQGGTVATGYWISAQGLETDGIGANDSGNGATFTVHDFSNYTTVGMRISVASGVNMGPQSNPKVFYPMIRRADITDPTYEPYHESVEEEIEQIYADNGVLGAKNLLENFAPSSYTAQGVTFTKNSNGSITVNGTNTGTSNTSCLVSEANSTVLNKYIGKRLKMTGCKGNAHIFIAIRHTDSTPTVTYVDTGDGIEFVIPNNIKNIACSVLVEVGKTVNNETAYPMIRLASDPDDTYQPYAMTNRELTEKKINIADLKTVVSASSDFADFKTRIASL